MRFLYFIALAAVATASGKSPKPRAKATAKATAKPIAAPSPLAPDAPRNSKPAQSPVDSRLRNTAKVISVTRSSKASIATASASRSVSSGTSSGTPSPAAAEGEEYIIYPKDPNNTKQTSQIRKLLQEYVKHQKEKKFYESETPGIGVNFWVLPLTPQNVTEVKKLPNIIEISKPGCAKECFDPSTVVTRQRNARDELVYFSQRPNTQFSDYSNNYVLEQLNQRPTVYIVDTGAYMNHAEFDDIRATTRFIGVQKNLPIVGTRFSSRVTADDRGNYHGTCMLSKVAGKLYGVVKHANIVMVKIPNRSRKWFGIGTGNQAGNTATKEQYLQSLIKVTEDIQAKGVTRGVVLLAWQFPARNIDGFPGWKQTFREHMKRIEASGMLIVTGSGNDRQPEITGYPAVLGAPNHPAAERINNMLVVGAVDLRTNRRAGFSNHDTNRRLPHVYAPGVGEGRLVNNRIVGQTNCANGRPNERFSAGPEGQRIPDPNPYAPSQGTSPASASVAGLAAYFFAQNSQITAAQVKAKIIQLSWDRNTNSHNSNSGAVNGVYNEISGADVSLCLNQPQKRDLAELFKRDLEVCQDNAPASIVRKHARSWPTELDF